MSPPLKRQSVLGTGGGHPSLAMLGAQADEAPVLPREGRPESEATPAGVPDDAPEPSPESKEPADRAPAKKAPKAVKKTDRVRKVVRAVYLPSRAPLPTAADPYPRSLLDRFAQHCDATGETYPSVAMAAVQAYGDRLVEHFGGPKPGRSSVGSRRRKGVGSQQVQLLVWPDESADLTKLLEASGAPSLSALVGQALEWHLAALAERAKIEESDS